MTQGDSTETMKVDETDIAIEPHLPDAGLTSKTKIPDLPMSKEEKEDNSSNNSQVDITSINPSTATATGKDSPVDPFPNKKEDTPNLNLIMRIPITVQVLLGSAKMTVSKIMSLAPNAVIPLDRNVGDPIDIIVNGKIIARGEVVLMEENKSQFGISLTEIVTESGKENSADL